MEFYLVETGIITLRNHIEKNAYLRQRAIDEQVIGRAGYRRIGWGCYQPRR
jgi:hypothetical protein